MSWATTLLDPSADTRSLPGLGVSCALIVAHPGHELRVHGWLEQVRPTVFVLTDGSGGCGVPRLRGSETVLAQAGARRGAVFGRHSDVELYAALMDGRLDPFLALARDLNAALAALEVRCVVADWADGYNPLHDVCRYLVDAVAARLTGERELPENLAFALVDDERAVPPAGAQRAILQLDQAQLERKLRVARNYPGLEQEVLAALRGHGTLELAEERLFGPAPVVRQQQPFYETYGRQQVGLGRYASVLSYAEHVAPLEARLRAGDY